MNVEQGVQDGVVGPAERFLREEIGASDEGVFLAVQGHAAQSARGEPLAGDRAVDRSLAQVPEQIFRVGKIKVQSTLGPRLAQGRQRRRQPGHPQLEAGADRQLEGYAFVAVVEADAAARLPQRAPRLAEQAQPRRGQRDRARGAGEERCADLLFEALDPGAQRGG